MLRCCKAEVTATRIKGTTGRKWDERKWRHAKRRHLGRAAARCLDRRVGC